MRIPFTQHLGTKFMALVLGIILWGFAYMESFQDFQQRYKVVFSSPDGWRVDPRDSTISVQVSGPRRVIEGLISPDTPQIIDKTIEQTLLEGQEDSATIKVPINRDDIQTAKDDTRVTFPALPTYIKVTVSREITKPLPVKVRVEGKPASGYVFSEEDSRVQPQQVEVRGPKSLLEAADAIYTDPVNINGQWSMVPFPIPIDPHIKGQVVGCKVVQVMVQVGFRSKLGARSLEKVPVFASVPNDYGYKVTFDPPMVRVNVEGPEQALAALDPYAISVLVRVNSDDYKPDEKVPRQVTPIVIAPQGFTATAEPSRVGITVTAK